jgi:hypothetical protein
MIVLMVVMLNVLSGCRDSLKLVEVIYDQAAEEIDYANPTKVLVNDPFAIAVSEELPLIRPTDEGREDEEEESEPNRGEAELQLELPQTEVNPNSSVPSGSNNGGGGSTPGNNGGENDGDPHNPNVSDGDEVPMRAGTGNVPYYGSTGAYDEPPTGVDYVAACGEAATIVTMLAGQQGALLYTDQQWLSRPLLQQTFGSRISADTQAAWSGDGGDGSQLSDAMLDTMIADERLDCIFVMSGTAPLTSAQQERVKDAGIIVSVLPDMRTATNIKAAVRWIGTIFSEGDNANTQAKSLADQYISFHDDVAKQAANAADVDWGDNNGQANVNSHNTYTLYISNWDAAARYQGTRSGLLVTSPQGVAFTRIGYQWSPLTYYMSVGGAVNNAAIKMRNETGTCVVWQFHANNVPATANDFSPGLSANYFPTTGAPYDRVLLDSPEGYGIGSARFPAVVVSSQTIANSMSADKSAANETLYKVYGLQTLVSNGVTYNWVGPMGSSDPTAGGEIRFSTAGMLQHQEPNQTSSAAQGIIDANPDYGIYVNPSGLFESWVDGSVESILEAAWISTMFDTGGFTQSSMTQKITEFYQTFYGHTLTSAELNLILAGPR